MDIPALSTAMATTKLNDNVNIAVLKMAKETAEQQGEQMVEMLQTIGGVDLKL